MRKLSLTLVAGLSILLSACHAQPNTVVGAKKDAHGCIPSAGYQWCGKENQCVRNWELAEKKGLANKQAAFIQYCQ
ncbi:hypothetical protein [Candidatus Methylopumilus turicensis]|uniref:Lipoprotein n=1 Tax=Candidatus Methylopumilus turicensis TaxID=1581680 RepID=A0A0B7IVE1_9PROT|nr:hypothetical protein [Candidatus Methylopumilus turicensis]CEN56180.1 protein of unknown function [Candidatus Methylopumilus turicensis]